FQTAPDLCQLPQARGPCKAALLRYFYNSTSNACEPFTYGGCQGNDNNFETTEMCLRICQPPGEQDKDTSSLSPRGPQGSQTEWKLGTLDVCPWILACCSFLPRAA
uniref:BPTI/Kunitz inhibitor domain-containing protein n=1 Tax=Moschus moschiferus TaxID=68415 RepID=A0A8C6FQ99_MOSMO